jgi:hypothetical protein
MHGCGVSGLCPKKNKTSDPQGHQPRAKLPIVAQERENIKFFESLLVMDRAKLNLGMVRRPVHVPAVRVLRRLRRLRRNPTSAS